jgi:hypothetical protein
MLMWLKIDMTAILLEKDCTCRAEQLCATLRGPSSLGVASCIIHLCRLSLVWHRVVRAFLVRSVYWYCFCMS